MHLIPLQIKVPVPGTPVTLAAVLTAAGILSSSNPAILDNGKFNTIKLWPITANTGNTYVGLTATAVASGGALMSVSGGTSILKQVLPSATGGHQDEFAAGTEVGNQMNYTDFAFDATTGHANEGLVGYLKVL